MKSKFELQLPLWVRAQQLFARLANPKSRLRRLWRRIGWRETWVFMLAGVLLVGASVARLFRL
jgi:hypothetical protein